MTDSVHIVENNNRLHEDKTCPLKLVKYLDKSKHPVQRYRYMGET